MAGIWLAVIGKTGHEKSRRQRDGRLTRKDRNAYSRKVIKGGIVELACTGRISFVSGGDEDHHALARTGEKDTIGVAQILSAICLMNGLPI